ncbi:MAG: M23 family metallopeptidase [Chitinophagaceae bacterium]
MCAFCIDVLFFSMMNIVYRLIIFSFILALHACSLSKDPQKRDKAFAKRNNKGGHELCILVALMAEGSTHRVVQGYYSSYSHKNRAALDFKMKPGTNIYAARDGVVIRMTEENDRGGLKKIQSRKFTNLIIIQHNDGSRAGYWHLQKNGVLVNMGTA